MRKERDKVDQGQIIFFFFLPVGKKICHRERRGGGSKYRAGLLKFPIDVFSLSFLFFNELEALPLGGCLVGGGYFTPGVDMCVDFSDGSRVAGPSFMMAKSGYYI